MLAYRVYRASTRAAAPLLYFHLRWRIRQGLEHPTRWPERLGRPSVPRPPADRPLIWFHAVSLGEGLSAIPLIEHCIRKHPNFVVLMTTTTFSAFNVIKDCLPSGVIYQFAPLDTPSAVNDFLQYWKPIVVLLMESELWPNLIMSAAEKGVSKQCAPHVVLHCVLDTLLDFSKKPEISVALLNARMSFKSFNRWSGPLALPLISLMLSKLSLIAPLSTMEAIQFQLLHASPSIIHFAGDLKYGCCNILEEDRQKIENLQLYLANRPTWMSASIHKGEEETMLWVHRELIKMYPNLVTIIVTRHPGHGRQLALSLKREGVNVALRSKNEKISPCTSIYIVDTLGELKTLYRATPIAVVGGSFCPGLAGHNVSEAAAAGCAVLTGPHVGHFSNMISEMIRSECSSILQVAGKTELLEALVNLLSNPKSLEEHRKAAERAFSAISGGIVQRVWSIVSSFVLNEATRKQVKSERI